MIRMMKYRNRKTTDCQDLLDVINQRHSLQVVVFGHVHNNYGVEKKYDKWFINASQCNGIYRTDCKNQPIQFSMNKYTKKILDSPTVCLDVQKEEFRSHDNLHDDGSEQRTFNETVGVMGNQSNRYRQQIHSLYAEKVYNQNGLKNTYT